MIFIKKVMGMKDKLRKLKVKLNKKNNIVIVTVAAVIVVALGIFSFLRSDFHNAYSDSDNGANSLFSSIVSSDEKGVTFTGNDIITVKSFSGRMFVLTEKLLASVDSDGEIRYTKVHNYKNPAIEVSDKYGILFNRNSSEYMIFTARGIIYDGSSDEENDIIAAAINSEGTFALSTKSDSSASKVYLHTLKGEKKYIWACGEEYAVTLDVHSSSKKIAVGAIGARGGEILSKSYLLDIYSENAQCEFSLEGEGITDIMYTGKNIISLFPGKRVLYDIKAAKGAPQKSEFPVEAFSAYTDKSGNTAVISETVSGFDRTLLSVYTGKNQVKYTAEFDGKPGAVVLKGKNAYVSSEKNVYKVSGGRIRETYYIDFDAEGLVIAGGKIFAYSSGFLKEVS